jgi:membrane-bound metal-dependent hydrolase YbcI (DUF457 family)
MRMMGHIKISVGLAVSSFSLGWYMRYDYAINLTLAVALAIGSVAPDFIEMGIIKHRTYTHYPPFYIAVMVVTDYFHSSGDLSKVTFIALMGYAIGSLVHLLCDWPYYRGIPIFLPNKRVKLIGLKFSRSTNIRFERVVLIIIGTTAVLLGNNV